MILLSTPIANFVNDFQTWPKEDQDKIKTYNNNYGRGYVVKGSPAAADRYDGNIGLYLDSHLTQKQVGPFLSIIDYVKQQK